MGIIVEFNPELTLRDYSEHKMGKREKEECVPSKLEMGKIYNFLKKDQRCYWMHGEIPLVKTRGNGDVSRPIGGVQILEAIHFIKDKIVYTKGRYKVLRVINDNEVHFEGLDPIGMRKW